MIEQPKLVKVGEHEGSGFAYTLKGQEAIFYCPTCFSKNARQCPMQPSAQIGWKLTCSDPKCETQVIVDPDKKPRPKSIGVPSRRP